MKVTLHFLWLLFLSALIIVVISGIIEAAKLKNVGLACVLGGLLGLLMRVHLDGVGGFLRKVGESGE